MVTPPPTAKKSFVSWSTKFCIELPTRKAMRSKLRYCDKTSGSMTMDLFAKNKCKAVVIGSVVGAARVIKRFKPKINRYEHTTNMATPHASKNLPYGVFAIFARSR